MSTARWSSRQALEYAWLDDGEAVLGSDFDHERELILRDGHHGYLAMPKSVQFPDEPESGMQYGRFTRNGDRHPFLFLLAYFWSAPIVTDTLFEQPAQTPPKDLLVWTF